MKGNERTHFIYAISILVAIIIGLVTGRFADNDQIVSYVSFALTLASILLAVVAMVYGFISNAALSQSIGGLHQAAGDVRTSASSLDRLLSGIENKFGAFTEKVEATHELVRNLSNTAVSAPTPGVAAKAVPPASDESLKLLVRRSSNSGRVALYAAAVAFKTGRPFNRVKLFEILGKGNEDYYWGWLLALDAAGVIAVHAGEDDAWRVSSYPKALLESIEQAATDAPEKGDGSPLAWSKKKVQEIDSYFGKGEG